MWFLNYLIGTEKSKSIYKTFSLHLYFEREQDRQFQGRNNVVQANQAGFMMHILLNKRVELKLQFNYENKSETNVCKYLNLNSISSESRIMLAYGIYKATW